MTTTTSVALTAVHTLHQIGVQAEAIASRVAGGDAAAEFPLAVRELQELQLTSKATGGVWRTLDDLAETLLTRGRK